MGATEEKKIQQIRTKRCCLLCKRASVCVSVAAVLTPGDTYTPLSPQSNEPTVQVLQSSPSLDPVWLQA